MQTSSYRVNQQLPSCADDQKDQDRLAIAPPNRCTFLSSCQYPRSIAQGLISHLALKLTLLLELQTCTSIQAPHRISQQRRNNGLQKGLCWGGEKSQRLTEYRQHSSSPTHALILLKLRFLPLTYTTWLLLLQTIELQLEVRTSQHENRYQSWKKLTLLQVCKGPVRPSLSAGGDFTLPDSTSL